MKKPSSLLWQAYLAAQQARAIRPALRQATLDCHPTPHPDRQGKVDGSSPVTLAFVPPDEADPWPADDPNPAPAAD
ncbi:MAG: hypothetical protein HC915_21795 [Anaerolineae bacterium]|nr:hypothetical protein [Anaerolineae bacterium]